MDRVSNRLLLINEDPAGLRAMSRILSSCGDQRLVTSSEQGLLLAQAEPPDLIVLDLPVHLPLEEGMQPFARLKRHRALSNVPLMLVVDGDSPASRADLDRLGVADCITRTQVPEMLHRRVSTLLAAGRDRQVNAAEAPQAASAPAKLLVVDDDGGAIELVTWALQDIGEVIAASSGRKALEIVNEVCPDVILLDASMPDMDGFEACTRLKAMPSLRHVPIVFVTKLADPVYEKRAFQLGAADFVTKPYSPPILQARVRHLLELKRRVDADIREAAHQAHRLADARIRAIVAGASDAIVTIDNLGAIVLMNAAAGAMFEIDPEAAQGRPAREVIGDRLGLEHLRTPPDASARTEALWRAVGAPLPVEVSVSSVGEGALRLTTLMVRDLSDRQRLEAESRARYEAEVAAQTKSSMLAFLAHEMGNPLNCMLGFAQLMRADKSFPLAPVHAQRVEMICAGGEQLKSLMGELSELGRSELAGFSIDLAPLDVVALVRETLESVDAYAQQHSVLLRRPAPTGPLLALGDVTRLRQCLMNLLSNGIKYNRQGGHVEVQIGASDEFMTVTVMDNGIGMTQEQLVHLYEPFNRLGRQATDTPGTGLGLVVTRQLIEAMQGTLTVTSAPKRGSVFTIRLQRVLGR